jgi:hypothetical protein
MGDIGVTVTKSVRIDREGARVLLRAFADWVNTQVLPKDDVVVQEDVETFLKRYANLAEEGK